MRAKLSTLSTSVWPHFPFLGLGLSRRLLESAGPVPFLPSSAVPSVVFLNFFRRMPSCTAAQLQHERLQTQIRENELELDSAQIALEAVQAEAHEQRGHLKHGMMDALLQHSFKGRSMSQMSDAIRVELQHKDDELAGLEAAQAEISAKMQRRQQELRDNLVVEVRAREKLDMVRLLDSCNSDTVLLRNGVSTRCSPH